MSDLKLKAHWQVIKVLVWVIGWCGLLGALVILLGWLAGVFVETFGVTTAKSLLAVAIGAFCYWLFYKCMLETLEANEQQENGPW